MATELMPHGPYPAVSEAEVAGLLEHRDTYKLHDGRSTEAYEADIQSKGQYDQSCEAIRAAIDRGDVAEGIGLFAMSKTLKPWDKSVHRPY